MWATNTRDVNARCGIAHLLLAYLLASFTDLGNLVASVCSLVSVDTTTVQSILYILLRCPVSTQTQPSANGQISRLPICISLISEMRGHHPPYHDPSVPENKRRFRLRKMNPSRVPPARLAGTGRAPGASRQLPAMQVAARSERRFYCRFRPRWGPDGPVIGQLLGKLNWGF